MGRLVLERPDLRPIRSSVGLEAIERRYSAERVVEKAWCSSDWLIDAARAADKLSASSLHYGELQRRIGEATERAGKSTRRNIGWFAIRPEPLRNERGGVVGVAFAKEDVSGSWPAQAYKRIAHPNNKVYACISDIDVVLSEQRRGIGAALMDASLRGFDAQKPVTTYVSRNNEGVMAKLGELGFKETGSRQRTDLFGEELPIEEVRLQASSVADVQAALRERYDWLRQAEEVT